MMRKYGICVALIVALLTAALAIGCIAPVDFNTGKDAPIPAGMGAVKVSLNSSNARATYVPATINATTLESWLYTLAFTAKGNGNTVGTDDKSVNYAGDTDLTTGPNNTFTAVTLVPGDYSLTVTAYVGSRVTANIVASGATTVDFTVNATGTTNAPVTLALINTGTGASTFTYSITNNTGQTIASTSSITLTPIGAGTGDNENLASTANATNATGTLSPTPGFYYIDLDLIAGGATVTTVNKKYRHIAYMYQNLTTNFSYTFTDKHFNFPPAPPASGGVGQFDVENPSLYPLKIEIVNGTGTTIAPGVGAPTGTAADPIILSKAGLDILNLEVTNAEEGGLGSTDGTGGAAYTSVAWDCQDLGGALAATAPGNGTGTFPNAVLIINVVSEPWASADTGDGTTGQLYQVNAMGLVGSLPNMTEIYILLTD